MTEVFMSPEASQEYQRAVEEAANAFMKVMNLRGFQVRDYPQNFVAQMAQTTRLASYLSMAVGTFWFFQRVLGD